MEIERKFLIHTLPADLKQHPHDTLCQAYLCTTPVIRVRQKNDSYILTVKSSGLLARQEMELPLDAETFAHLLEKKDGIVVEKMRYKIPERGNLLIELDVFHGVYEGFCMAEVEFATEEEANAYLPPSWFGKEVTYDPRFQNSQLSKNTPEEIAAFLEEVLGQS